MGEWLVPFEGRNDSYACHLNFLWRIGSLYVMDNHRAAAWCWLQHGGPEGNATVLHIDAHYDTAGAGERSSENQLPTASLGLREYLDASFHDAGHSICVYRWDNYISLLRHHHPRFGSEWTFATHRIGTRPDFAYTDVGTPEKANCSHNAKAANERRDSRSHAWLYSDQRISHFKLPHGPEYLQEGIRPLPGIEPSTDGDKKEAEKPQDLLCAHHDKCH